jgi:uncharacterized membrane protein
MQGKATIAGHPLHPILVTVPIGCFVAAVTADVISIWAGPQFWAQMSTWLLLFGLISGLIAAFFGFIDYLSAPMTMQAKNLAAWHMALNVTALVVFGWACAIRFQDHTAIAGYALTGLGIVVLGFAGYLGGEVAHRHLVGSDERDRTTTRLAEDRSASERGEISTPVASRH